MATTTELNRAGLPYFVVVDADITQSDRAVLERNGLHYRVEVDSDGNSVAPGGGNVGGAALLVGETNGVGIDFSYATDASRVAVKTAGTVVSSGLDNFFQNSGTTPKLVWGSGGLLEWSPHNLFLNSAVPATQSVTTIVGMPYTVTVTGSGSLTGSAGAAGVATAGSPLIFVATTTTSTFTLAGSLTQIQMNMGRTATAYLSTTAARRYGLAIDYDPVLGPTWLIENTITNICLWASDMTNAAWVKTNMTTALTATGPMGNANSATTVTATAANATALQAITNASSVKITSVFLKRRTGTGNVDITQDNGTTWATQAITSSWARYVIAEATVLNPTIGIRLATSGDAVDVAFWQCENSVVARSVTSPFPTFSVTQNRLADNYTFLLSTIPPLGAEYSMYVRFAVATPALLSQAAVALTDGTANEQSKLAFSSNTFRLQVLDGGTFTGSVTGPAVVANTLTSAAARIKLNDFALSVNGGAVGTDVAGTLPTVTETRFGGIGTNVATSNVFRLNKLVIVTDRGWNDATLIAKGAT